MRSPETRTLPLRRGLPVPSAIGELMITVAPDFCCEDEVPRQANKIIGTTAYLNFTNSTIFCTLLRSLDKFLRSGAHAARAQTIPHHNQRDGDTKEQRGTRVDFGRDSAAKASPDF